MTDQFTLSAGTWAAVRDDGSQESIVSDGTATVDVSQFAYVMADAPKQPKPKHVENKANG